MNHERKIAIYKKAEFKWGRNCQIIAAIEELNECAAVLSRYLNGKCEAKDTYEEIADAEIMIEQLREIFSSEDIDAEKNFKLNRLNLRLLEPTV